MKKKFLDSYKSLLWIMPFLMGLHNLEEAPGMVAFSAKYLPGVHFVTGPQFHAALVIVTLGGFAAVYASLYFLEKGFWGHMPVAIQAVMLLNALSHVGASILFLTPAPGVYTALLVNIPFALLVFRAAFREHYIDRRGFAIAFVCGAVVYLPLIALSLVAGSLAEKLFM
ncbi:MAG: HXXEE domain-containing protein [Spirochaetes bacterium]|nr:MAG: HXXEE domain-containing protein [Spirochaetota bacterium]